MELFKRDKVIKSLLLSLDIPQLTYPYAPYPSIGPSDPTCFERHKNRRLKSEKEAQDALRFASDEKLWELSETAHELSLFQLQHSLSDPPPWYAGGFGIKGHEADFEHWAKMDFWTLEEATCLSIGFAPEPMPEKTKHIAPYEALIFYHKRYQLFARADICKTGSPDQIAPRSFLLWLQQAEIEIPDELEAAILAAKKVKQPAMLGKVDARKHDTALKIILGLLASDYGYSGGPIQNDIKKAAAVGLAKLGLAIDRKTIRSLFVDVTKSVSRFQTEQEKKDNNGI